MATRTTTSAAAGQTQTQTLAEIAYLTRALKAPTLRDSVERLAERARSEGWTDEAWLPAGPPIAEQRAATEGGEALLAAGPHPGGNDFDEDEGDYAYLESLPPMDKGRLFAYVTVAAYDAVRAGVPLFRALLSDPDPAVRAHAAYALAQFP
jgi:hypothetical protein